MMTTGETIAEAPLPLLGRAAKAIPRIVVQAEPMMMSTIKSHHLWAVVGRVMP